MPDQFPLGGLGQGDATAQPDTSILRISDVEGAVVSQFFSARGLSTCLVEDALDIPGSHWGDDEAGLIEHCIYFRRDTPLHSVLHEACHWFLMDSERRDRLHTDAGGTSLEECAVCFLQIILAHHLPPMDRERMFADMDSWGYSFRSGGSRQWFYTDAEDALAFLCQHPIVQQDIVIGEAINLEARNYSTTA